MNVERKLRSLFLKRLGDNLAGVVIFGSYTTKYYREGISDIDTLIFLRRKGKLDFKKEMDALRKDALPLNLSIQGIGTLSTAKKRIYAEGSWSTWITLLVGSKLLYQTPSFKTMIAAFKERPLKTSKIIEYLRQKDSFELDGYLKEADPWNKTKGVFSHLRRKLQILYYYQKGKLAFDYLKCLDSVSLPFDKKKLEELEHFYAERKPLNNNQAKLYFSIAQALTPFISSTILSLEKDT